MFSCLALLFIFFANTYTKYKSKTFDNYLVYLFLLATTSMQLIEYFLWRNLKNNDMNELFSKIASCFIILQQTILMLMIPNSIIKYGMMVFYLFMLVVYFEYRRIYYYPIRFHTSIGKNGHLSWEWMNYKGYENIWIVICLLFYIIPLLLIQNFLLSLIVISTMITSLFF